MKIITTALLLLISIQLLAQKGLTYRSDTLWLFFSATDSVQINRLPRVWGTFVGTMSDQTDLNSALSGKQSTLADGVNIKTVNGVSILGSGDLVVGGADPTKLAILNNLSDLNNAGTARNNLGLGTLATQNGTITDYLTTASAASTYQAALGFTAVPNTRQINGSPLSADVNITTVSGNAGTATALQNVRTIWGRNFDGTANVTGTLTVGADDIVMTGSIGQTGGRLTKGWFTNLESTNMITIGGTSLSSIFQPAGTYATGTGSATGTNTGDNAVNTLYSGLAASKQDANANLTTIAGLTPTTDNFMVATASAWASRTPTQARIQLGLGTLATQNGTITDYLTTVNAAITYQPLNSKLTSIAALANANGYLKNNGSGGFSYDNPAGAGTVTDMSIVTANGISGTVATSTSTPAVTLSLGAITPTTVNGVTITDLLPKTTTAGVAATPTASGTVTITHGLGRIPSTIRVKSISSFTSNAAATPVPFSYGIWNSSGNRCLYMVINGTTTQASQTSSVFSIIMVTSAGNQITGVIQNVTATTFDYVFTETGTHTAGNYLWEAQ